MVSLSPCKSSALDVRVERRPNDLGHFYDHILNVEDEHHLAVERVSASQDAARPRHAHLERRLPAAGHV